MASTIPRISVSITVLRNDERTKREGDRGVASPPGLFVRTDLGESCHSVRPGLNIRPDCVIRVRGDGDPVAAEVHHVELAVRVVAPQGRREGVLPEIVDHGSAVSRADRSSGKQRSHAGIELCQGVELVAARANGLGIGVLIDEFTVYASLVFSTGGWLSPAVIYATHSKGLSVMTDWTIVLNVAMSTMGSARVRVALLTFALCTKSAILHSRPWALGLNITL